MGSGGVGSMKRMARPKLLTRIKAALTVSLPTAGTSWASMPQADANYLGKVGDGRGSSVVAAPMAWILRNWTEARLEVRQILADGTRDPLGVHPLAQRLRNPNAEYSGSTLQKATIGDYKLDGNAYWLIAMDRSGKIAEIWWAPKGTMEPMALERQDDSPAAQTRMTSHYRYSPGNGRTYDVAPLGYVVPGTVEGLAVLHFRDGIDPDNPLKGYSALKAVLREIYTDDEASTYTASLLRNMGVPGIIVSPTDAGGALPPPGPEDVKETKRAFHQATTGTRRGEPIIMTGPTRLDTFGYDPSQMDLASLRRIPEERVCGSLGVQPAACGLGAVLEQAKFANMQQAREASWEEGILPTQRDVAETITMKLMPLYEKGRADQFEVAYDVTSVRALQEDLDKIAQRAVTLLNGGVATLKEVRGMLNLESEDNQDFYRIPLNLIDVPQGDSAGLGGSQPDTTATGTDADDGDG